MADLKITQLTADTGPTTDDLLVTVNDPSGTPADKKVTISDVIKLIYPIGSYYINETNSTNPATLFGFGTWTAIAGRTIVGAGTSDQAFTAGVTGGESTHVLSTAELPAHSHAVAGYGLIHTSTGGSNTTSGGASLDVTVGEPDLVTGPTDPATVGSGTAHNNLQPYVVAYIWKRTA